jgi:hypothetical protein
MWQPVQCFILIPTLRNWSTCICYELHHLAAWPPNEMHTPKIRYEDVSKSFRTGRLGRKLQMVQLSAIRCSCIVNLWVSLVNFAAITLCVASQRVFIVVVCFVINSVRKILDIPSYTQPSPSDTRHTSCCYVLPFTLFLCTRHRWTYPRGYSKTTQHLAGVYYNLS